MKNSTIELLTPLTDQLRGYEILEEVRPLAFFLDGRDFIHFHEEPDGLFADVRLSKGRIRMPVATAAEQAELMERIEAKLSSLDFEGDRGRRGRRRARACGV